MRLCTVVLFNTPSWPVGVVKLWHKQSHLGQHNSLFLYTVVSESIDNREVQLERSSAANWISLSVFCYINPLAALVGDLAKIGSWNYLLLYTRENSVTERLNSLFFARSPTSAAMDLYNKIHWAIFSLPRYFARVGPLYYLYSLIERRSNLLNK